MLTKESVLPAIYKLDAITGVTVIQLCKELRIPNTREHANVISAALRKEGFTKDHVRSTIEKGIRAYKWYAPQKRRKDAQDIKIMELEAMVAQLKQEKLELQKELDHMRSIKDTASFFAEMGLEPDIEETATQDSRNIFDSPGALLEALSFDEILKSL